jgi:hypothetical protein
MEIARQTQCAILYTPSSIVASDSVLPIRQLRSGLFLGEDAFLNLDALRHFFAGDDFLDGVEKLRADQWVALDGAVQLRTRRGRRRSRR